MRLALIALAGCAPGTQRVAPTGACQSKPSDVMSRLGDDFQFVAAEDEPAAGEIFAYFAKDLPKVKRVTPEQADRQKNLLAFGRAATSSVIRDLSRTGLVSFAADHFTIGQETYGGASDGIAVLVPSPYTPGKLVYAYAGNSPAGVYLTQEVPTGDHDFIVVSPPVGAIETGDFCEDGAWHFDAALVTDRRSAWQVFHRTLLRRMTDHHIIYYARGTEGERDIDLLAARLEAAYAHVIADLGVAPLPQRIETYLWATRKAKQQYTGDPGNGVAMGNVVNALYGEGVDSLTAHEYVHVIASSSWGNSSSALISEGLAVHEDGVWHGEPLDDLARTMLAAGNLPPLEKLACCFRDVDDNLSYPAAGSLVGFVIKRFGLPTFRRWYANPDATKDILGIDATALEAAWHASLRH